MPARIARLYLDETGDFSPRGDDMRLVGGLLAISDSSLGTDLQLIHDAVIKDLAWIKRLHARELVEPRSLLEWHADGRPQQRALLSPAEAVGFDKADRDVIRQVGIKLLRRSQTSLRDQFKKWCGPDKNAFIVAGHVDDRIPGGAQAYDTAFDLAIGLAARAAANANVHHIEVEVAEPPVREPRELERRAVKVPGIASVNVVKYDRGSHGLWIADSLLAWTRPLPRRVSGSALDPTNGARRCLRVASSTHLVRPNVLELAFDYFADAVIDTEAIK